MIAAVGSKIIVRKIEKEQTTIGGIVLTNQQDPNPQAEILSIGPEAAEKNPMLKQGQAAHIAWHSVAEVKNDGNTYFIVDVTGIYAVEL